MDLSPTLQPRPEWSTAVPDWQDKIRNGRTPIPDLPLFDAAAEKALRVFKRLRVYDLIDQPTYGEVCEDWVFDLVRAIFGAYDPESRVRMIREAFVLIPKKNGKSAIAAAIIMTAAILNERPAAELMLIAPTQQIAAISFKQAQGMIALDPALSAIFHVRSHLNQIVHRDSGATIYVISPDANVVTGSKAAYVLVDETHVLAARNRSSDVFLEIRGGLASRPEGFLLQITTQSKRPPAGQFKKELDRARAVRDGEQHLPLLPMLYELPPDLARDEGWRDEATWGLVNPNLERSVSLESLRDGLKAAEIDGPDALALFASQHLNVQIGQGLTQDRWAGATFWAQSSDASIDFDSFLDRCEVVVAGIDGGGADDLVGLTFVGRERGRRNAWLSWSYAWAHPIALERRQEIAPLLRDLDASGQMTICSHPTQDLDEMAAQLALVNDSGKLPSQNAVGIDRVGMPTLIDVLLDAGLDEDQILNVSQGYQLNGAIKACERKLMDGSLKHAEQPLMTWSVSNAKTELRGNALMVTKAVSGTGKIDPVMALFNAVTLMSLNPEARPSLDGFLKKPVMVI